MSVELLELAADALGPELVAEVAFLGAATIGLWITEPAAPAPRPTRDVDVIVDVVSRVGHYRLGEALRAREFDENAEARQTCAWKHRQTSLELDVMPTDEEILGFSNRWYADALRDTVEVELPSGTTIRAVSPPYLLATKLEAFNGRGRDPRGDPDFLGSRDFGDVVVLIDGRTELVTRCEQPLRWYACTLLMNSRGCVKTSVSRAESPEPSFPTMRARRDALSSPSASSR